jgi:hypothetical protein
MFSRKTTKHKSIYEPVSKIKKILLKIKTKKKDYKSTTTAKRIPDRNVKK